MATNSQAISLQSVSRRFDGQQAIDNVSVSVSAGSVVGILGPNGAGKTTLMRLIAGWIPVTTGAVRIGGNVVKPARAKVRQQVFLVDEPENDRRPAVNDILQPISDYEVDRVGLANEVVDWMERFSLVGCFNKRRSELSRGQRYRMRLIGLFVTRPLVWLLDEPFSCGLDADGLLTLEQQMSAHAKDNGVVVFSTQWPEHAMRLADQTIVLNDGRLIHDAAIAVEPSDAVLQTASNSLRAVLEGLANRE